MSGMNGNGNGGGGDGLLDDLEEAVRKIIKNRKSTKAEKLSAITAGVKVAQIRHKITGGEEEKGFFNK
jgi:hypothetical protein